MIAQCHLEDLKVFLVHWWNFSTWKEHHQLPLKLGQIYSKHLYEYVQLIMYGWGYGSVVEHLTADQEFPSSNLGAPSCFYFFVWSVSGLVEDRWCLRVKSLYWRFQIVITVIMSLLLITIYYLVNRTFYINT